MLKLGRFDSLYNNRVKYSMEDAWGILLLSFAMLVGCFIAGTIPLTVPFSEASAELLCNLIVYYVQAWVRYTVLLHRAYPMLVELPHSA